MTSMTDRGMTVGEVLHLVAGEADVDAGLALGAWQTALATGLVDLLPAALAQRAQQLVLDGLVEAPAADRPALRLGPVEAAMVEQLRAGYRFRPRRRRRG
jgi:hypothetical protein